jgi:ATF/CREB family transcription factor
MFPVPSPNSQALYSQIASGGATPSTLDFHRTAVSAAAKREQGNGAPRQAGQPQPPPPSVTSQPQEKTNGSVVVKPQANPASGPFDPHDNDAANGLFMLAQGRNGPQSTNQFTVTGATTHAHPAPVAPQNMDTSPQMSSTNGAPGGSARGVSEGSFLSDESEPTARPNTRGKGKKNPPPTNGRRKADDHPAKAPPSKKMKALSAPMDDNVDFSDDDMMKDENGPKGKMTDEEKRKNFLERNRYALPPLRVQSTSTNVF